MQVTDRPTRPIGTGNLGSSSPAWGAEFTSSLQKETCEGPQQCGLFRSLFRSPHSHQSEVAVPLSPFG